MSRGRTLELEGRWALPVAISAFAAALLYIGATYAAQQGPLATASTADLLREYNEVEGTLALAAALNAAALFALAAVLLYLFKAAAARTPRVRGGLVGVVVVGPIFVGLAEVLQHLALSAASGDFVAPGGGLGTPIGDYAEDLIRDQGVFGLAQGLKLAGILGLVVGVVYTALWAMRVGLLTRFFGTFGMALGASLVLLAQAFSLLALMLWAAWLGLIVIDRVPGGRPKAWDAGEGRPWPAPGERRDDEADSEDVVEGEAAELFAGRGPGNGENPNAARRERARKRKRKRRR